MGLEKKTVVHGAEAPMIYTVLKGKEAQLYEETLNVAPPSYDNITYKYDSGTAI